ncbi:hypothetical protein CR513_34986, partial [Mucuna pruriens]
MPQKSKEKENPKKVNQKSTRKSSQTKPTSQDRLCDRPTVRQSRLPSGTRSIPVPEGRLRPTQDSKHVVDFIILVKTVMELVRTFVQVGKYGNVPKLAKLCQHIPTLHYHLHISCHPSFFVPWCFSMVIAQARANTGPGTEGNDDHSLYKLSKTPYQLTYGIDTMILVKISEPSQRRDSFNPSKNPSSLRVDLNLVEEAKEQACTHNREHANNR